MTAKNSKKTSPSYRVLVGANFKVRDGQPERRIDEGDVVDDLPEFVVEVLLEQHVIEEIK